MATFSTRSSRQRLDQVQPSLTTGNKPLSRVKSANAVTSDGKLFLFGGFDEDDNLDSKVYILDLKTNEWETRRHSVYREGHSALAIANQRVLVYGGVPDDTSSLPHSQPEFAFNELLVYSVKDDVWHPAPMTGSQVPRERSRHAACLSSDGTKMYISGGLYKDNMENPYDDLYCYDISTGVWDGPRKFVFRFDHYITHFQGKIWSFGGLTNEMAHVSEVSWFDLRTNTTGSIIINDLPKLEGFHLYLRPIGLPFLLDVVIPLWTYDSHVEMCVGVHNMYQFTWHSVLNGSFGPLQGYRWRHCFLDDDGLYLLGYPANDETNDTSFDYELNSIIKLDLGELGIVCDVSHNEGSLVSSMRSLLHEGKFADFQIIGVEGEQRPPINATFLEQPQLDRPFHDPQVDTFFRSKPLNVHKIILLARWPHFQRMIESGMVESQTNELFIPEPLSWLRSLMEFLYTDTLNTRDINIVTGLLILSNLYELARLRYLCLEFIYSRGFKTKDVVKIWSRAKLVNESILAHNAAAFCFVNWGIVVRTREFAELNKEDIVTLCQEVQKDGIVASRVSTPLGSSSDTPIRVHNSHGSYNNNNNSSTTIAGTSSYYASGFNTFTPVPMIENEHLEIYTDEEELEDTTNETMSTDTFRVRLGTPQSSIYLSNPQSALSSLGERQDDDDDEMD